MKMKYATLDDLLLLKLRSLYDIESELIKALPKMAKKASHGDLKQMLLDHADVTARQKERIEKIFELLGKTPQKIKVEAIRGLITDVQWIMVQEMVPEVLDISLMAAALYIEYYEIAGYTAAALWAEEQGQDELADMLKESKKEEQDAATRLEYMEKTMAREPSLLAMERQKLMTK